MQCCIQLMQSCNTRLVIRCVLRIVHYHARRWGARFVYYAHDSYRVIVFIDVDLVPGNAALVSPLKIIRQRPPAAGIKVSSLCCLTTVLLKSELSTFDIGFFTFLHTPLESLTTCRSLQVRHHMRSVKASQQRREVRPWAQLIQWSCKHTPSWKPQMPQDPLKHT